LLWVVKTKEIVRIIMEFNQRHPAILVHSIFYFYCNDSEGRSTLLSNGLDNAIYKRRRKEK
jgi:hypothetical protein